MGSPFAVATTSIPSPSGPGRYEGLIDESWTLMPLPQGGVVTAAAVRAMGAELSHDGQSLRSLHTTFVALTPPGLRVYGSGPAGRIRPAGQGAVVPGPAAPGNR